jgi:hypothetical protein
MPVQLDLFDRLNVLPPAKAVRGHQQYEVAYLSPGGSRRQHALLDGQRAICGASPGIRPLTWQPAYGAVTCPKCLSLLRHTERNV